MSLQQTAFSVLDLVPIREGESAKEAIAQSGRLAQHVEQLGYTRYWLAEHHNSVTLASSATSILIGYIASQTKHIRVGAGGIMLPNHAPLVVAEQFGTLDAMYPQRIDLGIGRAPGTDPFTARALRRGAAAEPLDVLLDELEGYFAPTASDGVRATPGEYANIPRFMLGSSTYSAHVAAQRGMPYAFASHFAPDAFEEPLAIYRQQFKPSAQCDKPYVAAGVNVIVADTEEEAAYLATTFYQFFLTIVRRSHQKIQPPVSSMEQIWTSFEKDAVLRDRRFTFIGTKDSVKEQLEAFVAIHQVDELLIVTYIYDEYLKQRSYTYIAELMRT
ncbi:LLM class flavin-dependent oxidoreductase [Caryophanon tenue]|uniref:Luciferase n=1 Tax=Caryophanon tenue TaxID=33978 RepID=A0A1C0Y708_9BACL|nr:LLM class flavin-dependent oxidoreductase [Caryophanon tenue]OCS82923.1 luciferase [Caryophanon tenue]